jgi:hypothetical protein
MQLTLPSERNFDIYQAVTTEQLSVREAAQRFRVSPARVQQIVAQVKHFVLTHGCEALHCSSPERLELGSLRMCYVRLEHYQRLVMRSYHAGPEPASVSAQCRLLQAAARLSIDLTRVVGRIAKVQLDMLEAGTLQREELENVEFVLADEDLQMDSPKAKEAPAVELDATVVIEPPAGGYTPSPSPAATELLAALQQRDATPTMETICDNISAAMSRRKAKKLRRKAPIHRR